MSDDAAATARELVACLSDQAQQFRVFLDLLVSQREALVARTSPELERIVAEQERAIEAARRLEQHRRALTTRLVALQQHRDGPLGLAGIKELVAASDASRLDRLFMSLGELQKEIERRQQTNRALIENSVRCTAETLQWLARRVRPQPRDGRAHTPPAGGGRLSVNRRW